MRAACLRWILVMLLVSGAGSVGQAMLLAQAPNAPRPQVPQYLPNPADEDWSVLADPARRTDRWDPLKYIRLGKDGWFATLSGEVRFRPELFRVRGPASSSDGYLLQRYLFGSDVHFGSRVRAYAELQSGIINGRLGTPRPTDSDTLDFHQVFAELRIPLAENRRVSVKVGRQELAIGSTRLISASPGLNVKRSFDGVLVSAQTRLWTVRTAAAALVDIRSGAFDDHPRPNQWFWGVSANRRVGAPPGRVNDIGLYYLGIDRKASLYPQGSGAERRHTIGLQWTAVSGRFDRNYDIVAQWGGFNDAPIRAWAVATETGYRLGSGRWRSRVSARADVASGDRDRQSAGLQTFNPLFPGNSYSGAIGLLGPSNVTDFNVSWMLFPRAGLTVGIEAPSYWRTSLADGVYNTQLQLLIPPAAGEGRYVGTNPGVLAVWQVTRHLQLQTALTRFISGRFLDRTFVTHGFGFASASGVYRF